MKWMPIITVVVAWLVASFVVVALRGKQLSRPFCILVLLSSSLGAGVVQYFLFKGVQKTERLSAAHLVGVSSLRLKDDVDFVRNVLITPFTEGNRETGNAARINWKATFQMKAADISATLAAIERNTCIRTNYSVWMGEIEFHRGQLERIAQRVIASDEDISRQSILEAYLVGLELAVGQLDSLAHEMRSRAADAYYE